MDLTTTSMAHLGTHAVVGGIAGGSMFLFGAHNGRSLLVGAAVGMAAGATQSLVSEATGSRPLGWGASIGGGAVAGAALFGLASPLRGAKAAAVGLGVGAAVGALSGIATAYAMAKLFPDPASVPA
jgi:hypothetical protein